jgi:hypothetical protein
MRVVITGGTGFVGRRLVSLLLADGHQVQVLTRNLASARRILADPVGLTLTVYDPYQPSTWAKHLEGWQGIVNLAGEPLATGRWTPAKKAEIRRSRSDRTRCLVEAISFLSQKPEVLVSGSAIGYYGPHSDDDPLSETATAGQDFLAQVSTEWEAAAQAVTSLGVRLVIVRTGIVMGPEGGALAQIVPPFQIFMGGPLGNGQQWFSWIHREDLVRLIQFALVSPSVTGCLNGTAPHPVKMAEFCQTLGQVIGRPAWVPVPAFALELLLGEAAQVVLTGQRVIPQAAEAFGFHFQYPHLKPALQQILIG